MTPPHTNSSPFAPSIADCDAHAQYWRDVAKDPLTNEAGKKVARAQELAWLTISMNIADLERTCTNIAAVMAGTARTTYSDVH